MKGHLGFVCRVCRPPSAPQNLRQVGVGTFSQTLAANIAWDAPESTGDGPVLEYVVEVANPNVYPLVYYQQPRIDETATTESVGFCNEDTIVRVRARNRCGLGDAATKSSWDFLGGVGLEPQLFTASGQWTPPCWADTVKVWCVGCGGTGSAGGGGGSVTWKVFSRDNPHSWLPMYYTVLNASDSTGPARASVTYQGVTISAGGGDPTGGGFVIANGDGGKNGGQGGQSVGTASFTSLGITYSGHWNFGGALGGGTVYGSNDGGDNYEARAVSPCKRIPAHPNTSGLLSAVALTGRKVTEDCATEAAFGSGGVRIPYDGYGGQTYFAPGYGGGGFPGSPGGPGCVVFSTYWQF